jgi:thiamine phosphate synthase YjbQ (UPF0047 family)
LIHDVGETDFIFRIRECLPVADGKLQLGTWQGIFLFEHRRESHRRNVSVTILGE